MMNDRRTSYRWQDHVIPPRRTALNLLATVLSVAVIGAAGFATRDPTPVTQAPVSSERTPSLAEIAKPPAQPRPSSERLPRC